MYKKVGREENKVECNNMQKSDIKEVIETKRLLNSP